MEKVQVFVREDQKRALEAMARRTGRKQSEIIRQGVDLALAEAANADADWKEEWIDAVNGIAGLWADRSDKEILAISIRSTLSSPRRLMSMTCHLQCST